MFLPNVIAGLSNIRKTLVNNGRFVAAVWASPDKVPFMSVPLKTLMNDNNAYFSQKKKSHKTKD